MPSYDYECKKCGIMEISHSMFDFIESCPICSSNIKKIVRGAGVIYKSAGFYSYDQRMRQKPVLGK